MALPGTEGALGVTLSALLLIGALVATSPPAIAEERTRVDLYDASSRRTGYVIVDPKSGRVDTYDARSNRTGWGRVDEQTGTLDLYDLKGNRTGTGRVGRAPTPGRGGERAR